MRRFLVAYSQQSRSEMRINMKYNCPYDKKCGGCSLLAHDYEEQLKLKKERLAKLLSPYGRLDEVIGMDAAEATLTLDAGGLKIRPDGHGIAKSQNIEPNTVVARGSEVVVHFEPQ